MMDVIDFADSDLRNDPHPAFSRLRHENPICPVRGMRAYFIARHSDCAALLRHPDIGFEDLSNLEKVPPELKGYFEMRRQLMLFQNPPEHAATRKAGEAKLQGMSSAEMEEVIRSSARRLLKKLDQGECEFIAEIARPFVAEVIAGVLGASNLDLSEVTRLAQDLADSLDPLSDLNSRSVAGERYLALKKEVASGCPFSGAPDLANLVMLVAAGLQTTGHILGLSLRSLIQEKRSFLLDARAVEELYRYHSPAQMTRRVVLEEVEIGGKILQSGTVLWLGLASANRDKNIFENSQVLDFSRFPNRHLAFGLGSHHCIGFKLARLQLRIFFEEAAVWQARLSLVEDEARYNGNLLFKGLAELQLNT